MATTLSDVSSLFGTNSSSLLATLYGLAGLPGSTLRQNPAMALATAERDEARNVTTTAAEPVVKRAVDAFTAGVNGAKTVQELLANPAVMQVLLTAGGLSDQIPYTALASKALQSQLSDPKSLANTLSDTRWKQVVQTYDFANKGLSVIKQPAVLGTIANAYAEVTWRKSLDAKTPGLSNALAFRKEASTITSVDQILGDPVMRNVVTIALGIPLQIAFQPLEAQEKAVSARLDINKFKDPKFVESFVQRYLIAANNNATDTTTTPDLLSLAVQSRGLVV
jgi:hypothetical protein